MEVTPFVPIGNSRIVGSFLKACVHSIMAWLAGCVLYVCPEKQELFRTRGENELVGGWGCVAMTIKISQVNTVLRVVISSFGCYIIKRMYCPSSPLCTPPPLHDTHHLMNVEHSFKVVSAWNSGKLAIIINVIIITIIIIII